MMWPSQILKAENTAYRMEVKHWAIVAEQLRAENAKLRAALEEIVARYHPGNDGVIGRNIARAALNEETK